MFTLLYFSFQLLVSQLISCDDPSRLACVLISSFVGRVSPTHLPSLRVLSSRIPVLRVIQGMTHVLRLLASLASPDEHPRLRQIRQRLTHLHPLKSPILPPESPPHPTEKMHQKPPRQHYKSPTSRTSSGRISRCPNPNLPLCLPQKCSKRF